MTVSDEAVEAAAKAIYPRAWDQSTLPFVAHGETVADGRARVQRLALESARAALEAAAPLIRAEALEELADEMEWVKPESACEDAEACCGSAASCDRMRPSSFVVGTSWLRARAAEMRQG